MPSVAPPFGSGKQMKSAFAVYSQQAAQSKGLHKVQKNNKKKSSVSGSIKKLLGSTSSTSVSEMILTLKNQSKTNGKNKPIVPMATPQLAKPDYKNLLVTKSRLAKDNANGETASANNVMKITSNTKDIEGILLKSGSSDGNGPSVLFKSENGKRSKSVSKLKINKETFSKNVKSKNLTLGGAKVASSIKVKKVKKNAPQLPLELELDGVIKMVQKRKLPNLNGSLKNNSKTSKDVAPVIKFLLGLNKIKDTKSRGERVLQYLIAPHSLSEFFNSYWEKNQLLIKRKDNKYFDGLFSTAVFDNILRQQHVEFTKNLDVTSYSDGVRETHNPVGRVYPPVVWDYYSNGCSLRMLNPQTFHKPVWRMLACLQDYMGSFCGANMYLTPAGTQGFAPHWDDIEAFILQLEGKKRWRVYKPRCANEFLPRFSSPNLSQEEIGEPILDTVLEAGDMLYFPRGFIHQGEAVEDEHSLHITFSTYQKNAWADLFEKIMSSSALAQVAASNSSLRQGLPIGCFEYMGSIASSFAAQKMNAKSKKNQHPIAANDENNVEKLRKEFKRKVVSLMVDAVLSDETVDRAVDEMARCFVRVALPPSLSSNEVACSVKGDGERWGKRGVVGRVEMDPESQVRLLGAHSIRLLRDTSDSSGEYRVYHSVENSREYEGREEQFVVVDEKHLPAVRHLVRVYPRYTAVENLPLPTLEDKVTLAMALWEQHLLVTELPLEPLEDDEDTSSSDDE